MKKVLSLLLTYTFLSTQVWALSGGPVFGGGGGANGIGTTVGTYTGVLTPKFQFVGAIGTNSLGLFSLGIPNTAFASGAFVYFSEGKTYTGTIVGVADPDSLQFSGLVKAQFNIDINAAALINTGTGQVTNITFSFPAGYANGSIETEISPVAGFSSSATLAGNTAVRMEGSATLAVQAADVNTGAPIGAITTLQLTVDGFKQSATADVSADLAAFGLKLTTGSGATGG